MYKLICIILYIIINMSIKYAYFKSYKHSLVSFNHFEKLNAGLF